MRRPGEFVSYVSVGVGMALGTSALLMIAGLFEIASVGWVLVALVLAALCCTVTSLSIGELASMYPSSPAIRTYFKVAFSDRSSLALVYLYLIFLVLIAGVESFLFALVVETLAPGLPPLLTVVMLLFTIIVSNLLGLELPRAMQMITSALAVAVVLFTGTVAVLGEPTASAIAGESGPSGSVLVLPSMVGLAVFLFVGFEWVTPLGMSSESYRRRIPLSMPVAIGVLLVTYAFFSVGLDATLPPSEIMGESIPQVPYFSALFDGGRWVAGVLSLLAIFSTFNAGLMGGSRLIFVLAHEGTLPARCGQISSSSGAPFGAIIFLGSLATVSSVVVVILEQELLAATVGATLICVIYVGYSLSVVRLRELDPLRPRPFMTPFPVWSQWIVIVVFGAIAVATPFSLPALGAGPAVGVGLALALAIVASGMVERARRRSEAPPAATRGSSSVPGHDRMAVSDLEGG